VEGGGFNRFDPEKEQFISYRRIKGNPNSPSGQYVQEISGFQYGAKYFLWIGTNNGLDKFDYVAQKFTRYPPTDLEWPNNYIQAMSVNRSGNVWIGCREGGLHYLNAETEQYLHYQYDPNNPKSLSSNLVQSLYEDRSGILWIGTRDGLNQLDPETGQFTLYYHDPTKPKSLRNNNIRSLYEDSKGILWIGTSDGLHQLDREGGQFIRYYHDSKNPNSLSDNSITAIYEDNSGVLWIGTEAGLNRFAPQKTQFKHYWQDPTNPNSLYNKSVNSVYETSHGDRDFMWIGTRKDGIYKIDRKTGSTINYRHDANNPNSLSYNRARVRLQSTFNGKDELWIGSYHGLNKLNPITGQFTRYLHDPEDPNSINSNIIWDVFEDKAGVLWIGMIRGGLQSLDRTTGQFTQIGPKMDVHQVYEDKSGNFWIAVYGGLKKLDRKTGQISTYRKNSNDRTSIGSDQLECLYESNYEGRNILWIGSNDGIIKFDPELEIFTQYKVKDGLPSEDIKGILGDDQGNLWLSTGNSLSRFNPKTETFRNYDVNDGLLSSQFNIRACYKSKDGEMFFGTAKGLEAFYPDSLIENQHIPPILLTDFQLFTKPVSIQKIDSTDNIDNYTLLKHISALEEIELSYKENIFSFEFAALDYRSPKKNQYAYRMEGFESDWNYTGAKRRFATYTNLDPGEYIFKVKGSNNDGLWNEQGTSIKITITPPWWKTNLAYTFYLFLFISMVFGIWRFQLNRERMKQQLRMEHFEAEKLREVDHLKSRFFTNISHEFRTPLTLIQGPAKQIVDGNFKTNLKEQGEMILRNSKRLLSLINQILDLSKLESGQMKLQAGRIEVITLLKGLVLSFSSLAERKKITLKFEAIEKSLCGYIDQEKIEKIITNLLSNAFKFTPEGGRIEVAVGSGKKEHPPQSPLNRGDESVSPLEKGDKGGCLQLTISNTGPGIPPEQLDKIFDRFYQGDTTYKKDPAPWDNGSEVTQTSRAQIYPTGEQGSGIGLALTKELVELHHGIINVDCRGMAPYKTGSSTRHAHDDPAHDTKTTFTVRLPIAENYYKPDEIIEKTETGDRKLETGKNIFSDNILEVKTRNYISDTEEISELSQKTSASGLQSP
jgi:two-component system sensor histidine kinase ChiS